MSERIQFQGRLAELKNEAAAMKVRMSGLLHAVRGIFDPFEPALEELRLEEGATLAVELAALQIEYKDRLDRIKALNRELGIKG